MRERKTRIERRGDWSVVVSGVGCRPATDFEVELWNDRLRSLRRLRRWVMRVGESVCTPAWETVARIDAEIKRCRDGE